MTSNPIDSNKRLQKVFALQKTASREECAPDLDLRLANLETLAKVLSDNSVEICEAINQDFGNRCSQETMLLELSGVLSSIGYTKKRLKKWMKPQKRHISIVLFGAKNRVIPQPKGVVGIVTPWNYPLFLALSPCVGALAAGNRCVIKMAANSQNLCRLMDRLISAAFNEKYLAIIPGTSASLFSSLAWDHLVFTGSAAVGKKVMEAASANLTPVTLELGGKSPTIICEDFDLEEAAKRILLTKFLNAGQTCVAPDYIFLPESSVAEFVELSQKVVSERYESIDSNDYTSVIDDDAFERLTTTLADAESKGAKAVNLLGGNTACNQTRKLAPHLITDVNDDMTVMQEEIFGPLLPIKTYRKLDEVLEYVNSKERPLALYLFTNKKTIQDDVLGRTLSGGVCINDCMLHVGQHDMPFGGVGNSGMGHYHGREGFLEFSKIRPVFTQAKKSGFLPLAPPYGARFTRTMNLMLKFRL